MNPPVLAHALLLAAAGDSHADLVAGDLHEEFLSFCEQRGRRAARRWYALQVLRSIPALLELRIRSGELVRILLAALLGVALPLLLLDRLWSFVYSQIPLKDGLDRDPAFLAANVIVVCICAAVAGSMVRTASRAAVLSLAVMAAAGFALWVSVGSAPAAYSCAVLLAAPASCWFVHRKWRSR